jgi:hypothetical protein
VKEVPSLVPIEAYWANVEEIHIQVHLTEKQRDQRCDREMILSRLADQKSCGMWRWKFTMIFHTFPLFFCQWSQLLAKVKFLPLICWSILSGKILRPNHIGICWGWSMKAGRDYAKILIAWWSQTGHRKYSLFWYIFTKKFSFKGNVYCKFVNNSMSPSISVLFYNLECLLKKYFF